MKKAELSPAQLRERDGFIRTLAKAGWRAGAFNNLFDLGYHVPEEASMEYDNRKLLLRAHYQAESQTVKLWLETSGGPSVLLVSFFHDRLDELLQALVGLQRKIDGKNFRGYVAALVEICPETYLDSPEHGGLVQLVEDGTLKPGGKLRTLR